MSFVSFTLTCSAQFSLDRQGQRQPDVAANVIVITGAASGLGRRMAQILAIEKKALLVIIDIDFVSVALGKLPASE
ncbi:hypothetical protein ANCDUO_00576 [Ancylostoma duodenale]|uniref:Uncharacterized protein n=1 Tax=Ancylostoma duodenale TaxID=51022 RepID=A0A0C2HHG7_9BILA|nr:hypothetical protein ANCDUO_00576 [Ancylostoma duodenale]